VIHSKISVKLSVEDIRHVSCRSRPSTSEVIILRFLEIFFAQIVYLFPVKLFGISLLVTLSCNMV